MNSKKKIEAILNGREVKFRKFKSEHFGSLITTFIESNKKEWDKFCNLCYEVNCLEEDEGDNDG